MLIKVKAKPRVKEEYVKRLGEDVAVLKIQTHEGVLEIQPH
jgi:hypothetical protein